MKSCENERLREMREEERLEEREKGNCRRKEGRIERKIEGIKDQQAYPDHLQQRCRMQFDDT